MHANLQQFVQELRHQRELVEVEAPVDAYLEIAEIHRRVIAAGGPALLFRNVKGKRFPVLTNMFGSKRRIDLAFGPRPEAFVRTLASLPETLLPPRLKALWQARDFFKQAARIGFRQVKTRSPVLACEIPGPDLTQLPALTSWSEDGGPFLTLPLVHTRPANGAASLHAKPDNLGMYRIQIFEPGEAGLHFQIGKGGGFHFYEAEQRQVPLPVNIYLGGPPALILSAIAPLPENVPELLLASLVSGQKLGRASAVQPDFLSPISEAEFVLQGHAPPGVRRPEGPFGDHYGYYSLQHDYPVFRCQRLFHRPGAIFPATVVGKPRQEDFYLGDYLQSLLCPLFPLAMPAVEDLWSYGETGYHALSAAVLKERYGRESMAAAFRILGEGQLSLTKFLLAVDRKMDLHDFSTVLEYVLARVDWARDLFIFSELAMDTLDYSGPEVNKGSKGVLLGMGEARRQLPRSFTGSLPNYVRSAQPFCGGCLLVELPGYAQDKDCVARLSQEAAFADWPLLIAVDDAKKAGATEAAFLWTTFTRFEPAADIYAKAMSLKRHHIVYEGPITIDARMKPWYPAELFCDERTSALVTQRWQEYFPAGKVEMGKSDEANLY